VYTLVLINMFIPYRVYLGFVLHSKVLEYDYILNQQTQD